MTRAEQNRENFAQMRLAAQRQMVARGMSPAQIRAKLKELDDKAKKKGER